MRGCFHRGCCIVVLSASIIASQRTEAAAQQAVATPAASKLPAGVDALWDLSKAFTETTHTRQRVCINGLWRWQPAEPDAEAVPRDGWGFFKVPGCWPGITDYMQKDCQTVHRHPDWQDQKLGEVKAAWYQRQVSIPEHWEGRRIVLQADYVNSFATVYVDGRPQGAIRFPGGDVDLTGVCRPGGTYLLSLHVIAMPLRAVMVSYNDTASARQVEGRVARRGLCGDVYLASTSAGPRIDDIKVATSVRKGSIECDVECRNLDESAEYRLKVAISDGRKVIQEMTSDAFSSSRLQNGRFAFTRAWRPDRLWDVDSPENMYTLQVSLCDESTESLDTGYSIRFGFREFWIDGRDFYLNGTRILLCSVPLDNAQVGAAWATYDAAFESMKRLQQIGINFVYTHNYGCEPGAHLSFDEILRAADDVGMLIAFSQPHFSHYDWEEADAERTNGYARHAEFYVRKAQNHPAVIAYATSHNATGYAEDMNPDMIDGVQERRDQWSTRNVQRAQRAARIIESLDSSRIVYHHASGNLGPMHTSNFYANFAPIQEMSDWFEHWATAGVKPLFTCEYSVPLSWDWTMYRGWYRGKREFGSARVPWEFCIAEWNAQFLGDEAYKISEAEKENLRWEAKQFQAGRVWHRWDYPHVVGSTDFPERYPIYARYFRDNWRAFRTWGVSAIAPWNHGHYWTLRDDVDRGRRDLPTDWQRLQRPGFSPDYIDERYERVDLAYEMSDWQPTVAAKTLIRHNQPLLAFIAGKPGAFTCKDHNFAPGETLEKQLIVINNSRQPITVACRWSLGLPKAIEGSSEIKVPAGGQSRVPCEFSLPADLAEGTYQLAATFRFNTEEVQQDAMSIEVVRPLLRKKTQEVVTQTRIALYDPPGKTRKLFEKSRIPFTSVDVDTDLSRYDVLVVGKHALTITGPAPNVKSVSDGLKVLLFEQAPEVLEQRLGFRVATYGLREVFARVPDHPILRGLDGRHLHDWRGESTVVPPRLDYRLNPEFNYTPTVRWCGILVPRLWRCGNRGNVATVLIEKPHRGDFLPILEGGYSLQYSPLLEYREGRGMMLFCQMDVTDRSGDTSDPVPLELVRNALDYVCNWKPLPRRKVMYAGESRGNAHLTAIGLDPTRCAPERLEQDTVLVVGRGGGSELAQHRAALARWLNEGGPMLLLGLDMAETNSFLPQRVETKRQEHIATWFAPPAFGSLLAGVGPADVHNPAPRIMPLLSQPVAVGNGVLGRIAESNVAFCQFPPFEIADWQNQHNLKRTFRRASFLLARLLANMGAAGATPVVERFGSPVTGDSGTTVVRNGDFSRAEGDRAADEWIFSGGPGASFIRKRFEAPTSGWFLSLAVPSVPGTKSNAMLAQHDVPVEKDQWYRIAFRARARNLSSQHVTMVITNMSNWRSLFDYQRFEPGPEWKQFDFEVQANEAVRENTRFQIWFEGSGELDIADVRVEPIADPRQGRWLEGLYLDQPETWDDPYRFFRW